MKNVVIIFGRVSTSIKAGIPAHVLSIANTFSSDPRYKFINLVPSLNPHCKTEISTIRRNFIEFSCSSLFIRNTFAFSLVFFRLSYYLSKRHISSVVHLHLPDPLSSLACILFFSRHKIVATYHADLLNKGIFSVLNKLIIFLLYKLNTLFIVPTDKHYSSTYLSKLKCPYKVVPFLFLKPSISNCELQKPFDNNTRFLFVGRLVTYKGLEFLIKAFRMFPPESNVSLDIIGDGFLFHDLLNLATGVPNIFFHGYLDDPSVIRYYQQSHVFCLPSISKAEAFGIVQVEAMLRHCACISSDLNNGVNDVNINHVSGLYSKPSNPLSLFMCMKLLHENKDLRNSLMKSAYDYAVKRFASFETKALYESLYSA